MLHLHWKLSPQRNKSRPLRLRTLLMAVLVLLGSSLAYKTSRGASPLQLDELPVLPLDRVQRLLVIAPHPDDETIGAGGAIQAALAAGAEVKVVIVTNGDGQPLGPVVLERRVWPHARDYVTIGEQRQAEALTALRTLGLPSDQVMFLGYPDGQLSQLWIDDWTTRCPLRARFTHATRSLYPSTFDPDATYCGRGLLDDLRAIIADFRPDMVLVPHPNDEHPDHWAASNFARMALALESAGDPEFRPAVWGYLVHYRQYPQPRGLHPEQALLPPLPLSYIDYNWARLDLDARQIQVKTAALRAHASQQLLLGSFLPSFARRNEIFANLDMLHISLFAFDHLAQPESSDIQLPFFLEPASESARQRVIGSADLVGLRVGHVGNQLWLTAEARGPLLSALHYQLVIKFPDGRTSVVRWPGKAERANRSAFSYQFDLSEAGDPEVLGFAAEVRRGVTLDRTGWHFLILSQMPDWGEAISLRA